MLIVLEDNPDKLATLIPRYKERLRSRTMIICDTVTKAQYVVQKLIVDGCNYELWLDHEVNESGKGLAFLDWLCENQYKPSFLLIITLGLFAKDEMVKKALAENIPHTVWAGPFG